MLRARLLREQTLAVREAGRLVAAAGVTVDGATATASGMVAPGVRGRGLGSRLLRWTEDRAGGAALTVATETLGPDAERLYARHGLVRTFAEEVMRHDLEAVPLVPAPSGRSGRAGDRGPIRPTCSPRTPSPSPSGPASSSRRRGSGWASWSPTRTGGATCPRWCWTPPAYRSACQRPRCGGFRSIAPRSESLDRPGRRAAGLARPRPGRAPGVEDPAGPGVRRSGAGLAHASTRTTRRPRSTGASGFTRYGIRARYVRPASSPRASRSR